LSLAHAAFSEPAPAYAEPVPSDRFPKTCAKSPTVAQFDTCRGGGDHVPTWGRCCSGSNDATTDGRDHSLSPLGRSSIVGLSAIRRRRPLTESLCSRLQRGVHPMPHKNERNLAFGPSALNDLARAFDSAWRELCAWGVEANTEQQIKRIRTKLAQRIMEYATEGEHDVEHLKLFGLQGLPHVCAHRVQLPRH
jgi:hypothetical protein